MGFRSGGRVRIGDFMLTSLMAVGLIPVLSTLLLIPIWQLGPCVVINLLEAITCFCLNPFAVGG